MQKTLFLSLLFFSALAALCQVQQNALKNWVLGDSVGLVFDNPAPPQVTFAWQQNSLEGVAAYNNRQGKLLYYTNGELLYNLAGQHWPVGGNPSTTQGAVFIPMPGDTDRVILLTLDDRNNRNLSYHIINHSLNNGNGGIESSKTAYNYLAEKLAATRHADGNRYWVLTQGKYAVPEYYAFLLGSGGSITAYTFTGQPDYSSVGAGQLKFSPSGRWVASAILGDNRVDIYSFDNKTGNLTFLFSLKSFYSPYGVEFSPDETKLYISDIQGIYQYNLGLEKISAIKSSGFNVQVLTARPLGSLQLGPDGKIYTTSIGDAALGVIENPNEAGAQCNFTPLAIALGGRQGQGGLPNFPSDYFFDSLAAKNISVVDDEEQLHSFPTSFSPNNDNLNDCYSIDLARPVADFSLEVYSRWGNPVYYTGNPKFCWSGIYADGSNTLLPPDLYYFRFVINFADGTVLKKNLPVRLLN